ncbi:MAG: hypothetical protein KGZ25_14930, partial [Planctomycetes bacterium]|nr:hypothetical protein [Planctomycetota bacterium]
TAASGGQGSVTADRLNSDGVGGEEAEKLRSLETTKLRSGKYDERPRPEGARERGAPCGDGVSRRSSGFWDEK